MNRLRRGVGQREVALQCECDNLETVYIVVGEGGEVRVTDAGKTFQYLDRGTDATYVGVQSLDLPAASRICEELGVELRAGGPDYYSRIECAAVPGTPIVETLERVAEAVDRVFHLALRDDLK